MIKNKYPFYLANKPQNSNNTLPVYDKYSGDKISEVAIANQEDINQAITKAVSAQKDMQKLKAYQRQNILSYCVDTFKQRHEELSLSLCVEAGKPIKDAKGEVDRLIDTFRIAAEEAVRIGGEVIPMDISARTSQYSGMSKRVPIGPCSFITPFNFPLNLVAHKVAPAIACGCPFILKPASLTPISALILGEILSQTDLPEGAFSILPCTREGAALFTTDDRLKLLSFTGSPDVGWDLKAKAGKKKVVLELGGNAAVIVDKDADIEDAIDRIIIGAFYQSGQSCISVQRIIIHQDIYQEFENALVHATSALQMGDPKDTNTFIGPMISEKEASRLDSWITEATEKGSQILCGGKRQGSMMEATLLTNVPEDADIVTQEAFGPIAVLSSFADFDQALENVNNSQYGLQTGIFTKDIYKILKAWDCLEVGGIIIGDVPSWRVDHMPYGGVKNSGIGREGIRYAIEDMTEIRLLAIRNKDS